MRLGSALSRITKDVHWVVVGVPAVSEEGDGIRRSSTPPVQSNILALCTTDVQLRWHCKTKPTQPT
jgi:hypothetical protein